MAIGRSLLFPHKLHDVAGHSGPRDIDSAPYPHVHRPLIPCYKLETPGLHLLTNTF